MQTSTHSERLQGRQFNQGLRGRLQRNALHTRGTEETTPSVNTVATVPENQAGGREQYKKAVNDKVFNDKFTEYHQSLWANPDEAYKKITDEGLDQLMVADANMDGKIDSAETDAFNKKGKIRITSAFIDPKTGDTVYNEPGGRQGRIYKHQKKAINTFIPEYKAKDSERQKSISLQNKEEYNARKEYRDVVLKNAQEANTYYKNVQDSGSEAEIAAAGERARIANELSSQVFNEQAAEMGRKGIAPANASTPPAYTSPQDEAIGQKLAGANNPNPVVAPTQQQVPVVRPEGRAVINTLPDTEAQMALREKIRQEAKGSQSLTRNIIGDATPKGERNAPISNTEQVYVANGNAVESIQQPKLQYQSAFKEKDTTQPFKNDDGSLVDYDTMKLIAVSRLGDKEQANQMANDLNNMGYRLPDKSIITPANISKWASQSETSRRLNLPLAQNDNLPNIPLSPKREAQRQYALKSGATETVFDPAYDKEGWTPNMRPRIPAQQAPVEVAQTQAPAISANPAHSPMVNEMQATAKAKRDERNMSKDDKALRDYGLMPDDHPQKKILEHILTDRGLLKPKQQVSADVPVQTPPRNNVKSVIASKSEVPLNEMPAAKGSKVARTTATPLRVSNQELNELVPENRDAIFSDPKPDLQADDTLTYWQKKYALAINEGNQAERLQAVKNIREINATKNRKIGDVAKKAVSTVASGAIKLGRQYIGSIRNPVPD